MGLMDKVMTSNGGTSNPYGRAGFHIIRVERITVREATADLKAAFMVDGRVLFTDREGGEYKTGSVIRFQDPCRYPDRTAALIRRVVHAGKKSLFAMQGKTDKIDEMDLGLTRKEGESDDAFAARVGAEANRLVGPDQPLVGSILVINATEKKNRNTGAPYTLFEPAVPAKDDLIRAGLVKAA